MCYQRRLTCVLLAFVISFSNCIFASENGVFNGWTHLELGAGNYGPDGHTKASQSMTVLLKIEDISDAKNYIDELEEVGRGDYKPEDQYGILFETLDELVRRYGEIGVFHVNDLYEEYAIFATQKLIEYAMKKGYDSIIIESVPGDYQLIDSERTLSPYGKVKYSSAHLKNPEASFYHDRMDGEHFFASEKSCEKTRFILKNLASLSENGLYLFILYHNNFIPLEERTEFMEKGIFYHPTNDWDSVPYIFPEGCVVDKEMGKVFHIKPAKAP
ncbi:MAG: hypothetical protein HYZ48_05395 [Chlamydiales bacterium]|nr:hypothetical protein [Chlamydiales bacterium]